jgi:transcriptional regulator with XRE-family HTH domain
MKIKYSEAWCLKMADLELGNEVGAGVFGLAQNVAKDAEYPTMHSSTVPFGRFVKLMRRNKRLTIEKLAEDADIDLDELVEIEDNAGHVPEPRTVYQLAQFFEVPTNNLMQVAGLSSTRDERLVNESMKFAARSDTLAPLSPEEKAALEAFVSILGRK